MTSLLVWAGVVALSYSILLLCHCILNCLLHQLYLLEMVYSQQPILVFHCTFSQQSSQQSWGGKVML